MPVKLPRMEREEIWQVIQQQMLCRIAFKGDRYPYLAPFQYVILDGALYFHFTDYGKKMKLIGRDSRVCVEIEEYKPDFSAYSFIVLRGTLSMVEETHERNRAIAKFAEEGKQKLSTNFLLAHGFKKGEDWSSFSPEKPLVIFKLADIAEEIGLGFH